MSTETINSSSFELNKNLLTLIDTHKKTLLRRQNSLTQEHQIRENRFLIDQIQHIESVAKNNPRLPWQLIQENIDAMYQDDKQIIGANIKILFEQLKGDLSKFKPTIYGVPKEE